MSEKQQLTEAVVRPETEGSDAVQPAAVVPDTHTPLSAGEQDTSSRTEAGPDTLQQESVAASDDAAAQEAAPTPSDPSATAAAPASETSPEGAASLPAPGGDGAQPPAEPPVPADSEDGQDDEKPMGLLDHLNELRWRLVRCFIAALVGFCLCWAVVEPLFDILTLPLNNALGAVGAHAQYTSMPEPFFTRMLVAFVTGLFISSPFIFYQIWAFIAPGLYDEEKRFIIPVAVISAIFFIGGGLFCYFVVFPYAFDFFIGFSTESIQITPRISDYLDFILKLLLAFGLIFEMPLFSFFLSRMGVLTADMMRRGRRYAIVGIFIVAAILTPPDVVSQLLMACPMLILYEFSIIVAAVCGKKKKAAEEQTEAENEETEQSAAPRE